MSQELDKVVMLLSTDWFFPYWHTLGICADDSSRDKLKRECRVIVSQILQGETDYWSVSFDEERLQETAHLLEKATKKSGFPESDQITVKAISSGSGAAWDHESSLSLLASLTELLLSDDDPEVIGGVAPSVLAKVVAAKSSSGSDQPNLLVLSLKSDTTWDKDLRATTGDLPEHLGDFATSICVQTNAFLQFWAQVAKTTTLVERKQILDWYQKMGQELTGRDVKIPDIVGR